MSRPVISFLPSSHLDLFWLGNYKTCLERGAEIIRQYVERCGAVDDETFLLDTVVFAEYFWARHPELRALFLQLVREGRLEVGAAYVDRWETLILGESLIRNIQLGKRWCREVLGIDNPTITHPDLPSMTPQIAQLYTQAGLHYYVTSRKVFPNGQVWRYRSPDGSAILVLNYPRHYVFTLVDETDDPEAAKRIWVKALDVEATLAGFPLGAVLVSGSAGDLTDRNNFREWFGRNLEDYVRLFRAKYPEFDFSYSTAARVLAPYAAYADLPCLSGEIPSVWGVAADEEATFFQRDRQIESQLLTAETLVAVAGHLQLPWLPPGAAQWEGTFDETTFFGRKDPILRGSELDELWRMHIFTQDHNGGGKEGALSTFQKRVIQQRCLAYTEAIIDQTLQELGQRLTGDGARLLVFNPHGQDWQGSFSLHLPANRWTAGMQVVDETETALIAQVQSGAAGCVTVHLQLPSIPAVGYRSFRIKEGAFVDGAPSVQVGQEDDALWLTSAGLAVAIDRRSGNLVHIQDRLCQQDWGGEHVGRLYAIQESGNDVTLRIAADAAVAWESPANVEVVQVGPLFAQVRIHKRLLNCEVEQTVTLWGNEARLDLQTRIYWWGAHNQQVRLGLPTLAERASITYGAPFYGVGWTETAAGTAPRNSDEISPADQMSYREVQGWLHLAGLAGGLTILTTHPAFYHDGRTLEAVLLRTAPSCGDGRLFWENAGEQIFHFTLRPGESDWRAANSQRVAACHLRPPVARLVQAQGGALAAAQSLLRVDSDSVTLSSLSSGATPGATLLRVWETAGLGGQVEVKGVFGAASAMAVNLLGELLDEEVEPLAGEPGAWRFNAPAWGVRTLQLVR